MNHETLWAREGDVMETCHRHDQWSPLASFVPAEERARMRRAIHGFNFRVESDRGKKTMIIEEAP